MKANRILAYFAILLAAFGFLIPAIFNGFPLVYSDTGTYIASGFQGAVPGDRPITYGLFLRHSSLAASLWFTIIAQALLLSVFGYRLFCNIWSEPKTRWSAFMVGMVLLILCSSISYFASMLMADISTSISLFLLYFLLIDTPKSKWIVTLLGIGYLFFSSMHYTNVYGHLLILIGIGIIKVINKGFLQEFNWRKWVFGSALVLMNFLFLPAMHFLNGGGFVTSKNGHLFITAKIIESGAMQVLLSDKCSTQNFALCQYKDSFPNNASDFLWLPESVLYKIGGWNEHEEEYKTLNKLVFSDSKYYKLFFGNYFKVLKFHFFQHNIGEELIPLGLQSPPGWEIESNFKEELNQFLQAKQAQNLLNNKYDGINFWVNLMLIVSLVLVFFELIFGHPNYYLKGFIWFSIFMYIGNLFAVCIASSGSRFNSRIDWLFVLCAILILFSRIGRLKHFAILK